MANGLSIKNAKRGLGLFSVMVMSVALLAGCEDIKFSSTTFGGKTTVEINKAKDGDTMETSPISVGKDEKVVVSSALDSGELKIDFAEATIIPSSDESFSDDVVVGEVKTTVTITGMDSKEEFTVDSGDYVMQLMAVGDTNGETVIEIVKK